MADVTRLRCNLLRALYLLLFVAIPPMTAARLVYSSANLGANDGWAVSGCLLAALALLCGLGVRQPIKMLPVLLLELLWKAIWMARVALPLFMAGRIDGALIANSVAIGSAVIMLPVIPWRFVLDTYVRAPADPWRADRSTAGVRRAA